MFNSDLKKEWIAKLEDIQNEYIKEMNATQELTIDLFENRKKSILIIKQIEEFINSIAKTPKE